MGFENLKGKVTTHIAYCKYGSGVVFDSNSKTRSFYFLSKDIEIDLIDHEGQFYELTEYFLFDDDHAWEQEAFAIPLVTFERIK